MKLYINENIQLIHISSNNELKYTAIKHAMVMAKTNKDYAKFYTDKWYISVHFERDGSVTLASNIKSLDFIRDKTKVERQKFTLDLYSNFIYVWMNRVRKSNYFNNLNT